MIVYLDSCALIKFVKAEAESSALRRWRMALSPGTELLTSEFATLEITRSLLRHGIDHQRVGYFADQALKGVYRVDLTSTVLSRACSYRLARLGSLESVHLASAEPFRADIEAFVTYDKELGQAASELGFPVSAPSGCE